MPKRGENIHKRKDGRWEGRTIDAHTPEGKAHYKSVYGGSYAEVKDRLHFVKPYVAQTEKCITVKTVKELGEDWLMPVKVLVKLSTSARYEYILNQYILTYFKGQAMHELTNAKVNAFVSFLLKERKLAPKTVRDITLILLRVIRYGEKHGCVCVFDYDDVALPKANEQELKTLTITEQSRLTYHLKKYPTRDGLGVLIALYTGARLGEICALTKADIDFNSMALKITKTIQRIRVEGQKTKTALVIGTPKSKKSIRTIPIPIVLMQYLQRFLAGRGAGDYVLTGNKTPIDPRTYQARFKHILQSADIEYINFHALRHTFATRAIEAGFDVKSLSEILGHSSVRFTLDRYVHSSDELKRTQMEKLAQSY